MLAIEMLDITKRYGSFLANDRVNFSVQAGTIHGLIGENGAGKSTLMKILYGVTRPTSGEVRIGGKPVLLGSSRQAIRHGLGMVHQHFMLVPTLTNLQNLILGNEPTRRWNGLGIPRVDEGAARTRFQELSQQLGFQLDPDAITGQTTVGSQQRLEIMKLLYRNSEYIILDEPTAVLTPQEIQELFVSLKKLKSQGKTIIIITHKLKEIMAITDQVTVLRGGKNAGSTITAETSESKLAEWMVGRPVLLDVLRRPATPGAALLSLQKITVGKTLNEVSLELIAGTIVGIAGIDGNGQRELAQVIAGVVKPDSGTILMQGRPLENVGLTERRDLGICHIAEDRHLMSGILEMSLSENILLGWQHRLSSNLGIINKKDLSDVSQDIVGQYDVRPNDPTKMLASLSGGNQQKVVVGRELYFKPKVIIAAQPTRGVDIGAIEMIHQRLISLARDTGAVVLLISTELDEILSLSDSLYVICQGRLSSKLDPKVVTEKQLGLLMAGVTDE